MTIRVQSIGWSMFNKIAAVQPFGCSELIVWFADGEARLYDARELMETREEFAVLKDEKFFASATLSAEGYGVSWGRDLDLGCKEIYDGSKPVDVVGLESSRVIGEAVNARHESGLSQAKLAAAAGVKQPVVARLETSVNSPRLDTLLKILTPLGKTLRVVDLAETLNSNTI